MIKATIITIGDEILIGQIVDTNSASISKHLNTAGITVEEVQNELASRHVIDHKVKQEKMTK